LTESRPEVRHRKGGATVSVTAQADQRARPQGSCTVPVWRRAEFLAPSELLVEVLRGSDRRFEMNPLLMVYFSTGASFAGLGLVKFQARLERWAYERHAED
jgi:hypothetical protein